MARDLKLEDMRHGTTLIKRGFAKMQKGGVVMDVTTAEQAAIAEEAGAVAVMALERVPADIRAQGGVARMSDPTVIQAIIDQVTIPVMAKARIGHVAEARVLESLGVDMIDESEVLTPADPFFHTFKHDFTVPFVCGATNLGEAVRRIWEGAAMIRTKGEAGTGNIVEATRHRRMMSHAIREVARAEKDDLVRIAQAYSRTYERLIGEIRAEQGLTGEVPATAVVYGNYTLQDVREGLLGVLLEVKQKGRLPVVDFTAGGIATPADAALAMRLGSDGVFVGSGIFKSGNPRERARAIVDATTHFEDAKVIAEVSKNLGEAMVGLNVDQIAPEGRLAKRGW